MDSLTGVFASNSKGSRGGRQKMRCMQGGRVDRLVDTKDRQVRLSKDAERIAFYLDVTTAAHIFKIRASITREAGIEVEKELVYMERPHWADRFGFGNLPDPQDVAGLILYFYGKPGAGKEIAIAFARCLRPELTTPVFQILEEKFGEEGRQVLAAIRSEA